LTGNARTIVETVKAVGNAADRGRAQRIVGAGRVASQAGVAGAAALAAYAETYFAKIDEALRSMAGIDGEAGEAGVALGLRAGEAVGVDVGAALADIRICGEVVRRAD
jgi:hypothetical protein